MDWLTSVASWIAKEWRVVRTAPLTFLVLAAAMFLGNWAIFEIRYSDRFDNQETSNKALQDQIALLSAKLSATAPELPNEAFPQPRTLTDAQMSALRAALDFAGIGVADVTIGAEAACFDCAAYQNELAFALSGVENLRIGKGTFFGPTDTHPSGVVILGEGFAHPNSVVSRLSRAFEKAKIEHGKVEKPTGFVETAARIDVQAPRKY